MPQGLPAEVEQYLILSTNLLTFIVLPTVVVGIPINEQLMALTHSGNERCAAPLWQLPGTVLQIVFGLQLLSFASLYGQFKLLLYGRAGIAFSVRTKVDGTGPATGNAPGPGVNEQKDSSSKQHRSYDAVADI